ncbi:hypothetical protein [Faecalispora anaeroviscerum]|uniref:hypothetical protein n=1 Tax=Faecalispora anaeroviscerum TaxID=2991836 RepID=UPI0024BB2E71|nr:hypothetical protein [Faecalispora anaeroviscerum]
MPQKETYAVVTRIRLDDERVLDWGRAAFALTKKSGTYRCECLENEFQMVQKERQEYEQSMLERIGKQMSLRHSRGTAPKEN